MECINQIFHTTYTLNINKKCPYTFVLSIQLKSNWYITSIKTHQFDHPYWHQLYIDTEMVSHLLQEFILCKILTRTYLFIYFLLYNFAGQLYCHTCFRIFKTKCGLTSHIRKISHDSLGRRHRNRLEGLYIMLYNKTAIYSKEKRCTGGGMYIFHSTIWKIATKNTVGMYSIITKEYISIMF